MSELSQTCSICFIFYKTLFRKKTFMWKNKNNFRFLSGMKIVLPLDDDDCRRTHPCVVIFSWIEGDSDWVQTSDAFWRSACLWIVLQVVLFHVLSAILFNFSQNIGFFRYWTRVWPRTHLKTDIFNSTNSWQQWAGRSAYKSPDDIWPYKLRIPPKWTTTKRIFQ